VAESAGPGDVIAATVADVDGGRCTTRSRQAADRSREVREQVRRSGRCAHAVYSALLEPAFGLREGI